MVEEKAPFRERRRAERFQISDATIICYKRSILHFLFKKKNIAKFIYNISERGIMFLANKNMPIGTRVYVEVTLKKFSDGFEALGEIRWTKPVPEDEKVLLGNGFFIGVEFTGISKDALAKIKRMKSWFTSIQYKAKEKGKETRSLKI